MGGLELGGGWNEVVGTGFGGGGGGRGRQAEAVGGDWHGPIGNPHEETAATNIGSERQTTGMSSSNSNGDLVGSRWRGVPEMCERPRPMPGTIEDRRGPCSGMP